MEGPLEQQLTPGQVAARKAQATGRMANTLAKALAKRFGGRWQFVDFHGPKGYESAGIVDIIAIRKCGKQPDVPGLKKLDLFDIKLIQVKGGSAPLPGPEDIARLRAVKKYYKATEVVLFEWVGGKRSAFSVLEDKLDKWTETQGAHLFGAKS